MKSIMRNAFSIKMNKYHLLYACFKRWMVTMHVNNGAYCPMGQHIICNYFWFFLIRPLFQGEILLSECLYYQFQIVLILTANPL